MDIDIKMVPQRIAELRDILGFTQEEVATKLDISLEEYQQYESGLHDIPISVLYHIAGVLNVDTTVLLTGDTPRMDSYTIVRKGEGALVERYPGYNYQSLSFNFKARSMEPLLVTLNDSKMPQLITHGGQEFNYCVQGMMKIYLGKHVFTLDEGDCVYFDPRIPHGQSAVGSNAVFLTVINE